MGRRQLTREERAGERITGRINRRARVMAAFTARPGELLDTGDLAAATGMPPDLCRSIVTALEADKWLRHGRNARGHPAWSRPADAANANGDGGHAPTATPTAPTVQRPAPAPGAARPGLRRFFCRTCRGGVVATDPPQGWLRVQVRDEALARRNSQTYATTGLFCSVACLAAWATTASNGEATG